MVQLKKHKAVDGNNANIIITIKPNECRTSEPNGANEIFDKACISPGMIMQMMIVTGSAETERIALTHAPTLEAVRQ
jgi:hypothetical protein